MNNQRVDVGNVLSRAFGIYGEQASTLLPVAFALFLVVGVISGVLSGVLILLGTLVSLIAGTLFQGMVVRLVEDVQDGRRDYTVGELFSSVTPVILPLILAGLIVGIGVTIGFILLIIPGVILLTIWSVTAPVIVIEKKGVIEALGRSRQLVKGNFGPTLGVIVIAFLIVFVASLIFGVIGAALGGSTIVKIIVNVISSTITAPISALVGAVLYFALRGAHGDGGPTAASAGPEVPGATPPPPPPPPAQ